jgi:hypothetical protein
MKPGSEADIVDASRVPAKPIVRGNPLHLLGRRGWQGRRHLIAATTERRMVSITPTAPGSQRKYSAAH